MSTLKLLFLWNIGLIALFFGSFYWYNQKMPGEGHLELFLSFHNFDIFVVKMVYTENSTFLGSS